VKTDSGQLLQRLEQRLKSHRLPSIDAGSLKLREAAVLVPLIQSNTGVNIVLTRRPMTLRKHPGQISFPGGAKDASDATLLHTALRETHEEIGIDSKDVSVIGMLGALPTVTSFYVTPFVAVLATAQFKINTNEIDELLLAPLLQLRRETRTIMAAERDVYVWGDGSQVVWGATFRMLDQLMLQVRLIQEGA
jgi:8-oxo-dGTP pyrophosphatase MutT (NUDIX family)